MDLGGYEGLKSAKAALDGGLIAEVDYEEVKVAYLRAQQIRAGLDAGFIKESDYQNIKRAFLNSLNLADPSFGAGYRVSSNGAQPSQERPAIQSQTAQLSSGQEADPEQFRNPLNTIPSRSSQPKAGQPTQHQPSARAGVANNGNGSHTQPTNGNASTTTGAGNNGEGLASRFSAPTNIPKVGGARSKPSGGTSMSGISVLDDAVNLYYYLKAKSAYRWAVWKINPAGDQVVIDSAGPADSSYTDFTSVLPPNDCRYAVVDMQFTNSEGCVFNKILFINWAPDNAKMRSKMMYASTKDFFKSYLDGISNEIQGGDLDDVSEQEAQSAVRASVTRL